MQKIIEEHQGIVNKYLGDGILAYWRDDSDARQDIISAVSSLKVAQTDSGPSFWFVLHFGRVAIGGVPSTREETLMGSELNLVFRLEKLLATLEEPSGISEQAHARLGQIIPCRLLGEYELKGFEAKRALFAI